MTHALGSRHAGKGASERLLVSTMHVAQRYDYSALGVCVGVFTVAIAWIFAATFTEVGRRALGNLFNPIVVPVGDSGDFWFFLAGSFIWFLILGTLCLFSIHRLAHREAPGKNSGNMGDTYREIVGTASRQVVDDVFRLTCVLIWLGFFVGPLLAWIATGLQTGIGGQGTTVAANNDGVGIALLSTITATLLLAVAWMVWFGFYVYQPASSNDQDTALWHVVPEAPNAPRRSYAEAMMTALDKMTSFLFGGLFAWFAAVSLAPWWVRVVMARGSVPYTINPGFVFAAVLILAAAILVFRVVAPSTMAYMAGPTTRAVVHFHDWDNITARVLATMHASYGQAFTLMFTFLVVFSAVPSLARTMLNLPAPFNNTNPLCPARVSVLYPTEFFGEMFLEFLISVALLVATYFSFKHAMRYWGGITFYLDSVVDHPTTSDEFSNRKAGGFDSVADHDVVEVPAFPGRVVPGRVVPEIRLGHADAAHPVTFAVGASLGNILYRDGTIAMLSASHAFCNPDQQLGPLIAALVVVAGLLTVAWTLLYTMFYKNHYFVRWYMSSEDRAFAIMGRAANVLRTKRTDPEAQYVQVGAVPAPGRLPKLGEAVVHNTAAYVPRFMGRRG